MKALAIILCAMLGAGCATQFTGSDLRTKLNCQDYANGWAREAQERGFFHSGVLWYRHEHKPGGHAICWIRDFDSDSIVLIEPQAVPVQRVELSDYERRHILNWSFGPAIWKGKCGSLEYKKYSDIGE